MDNDLYESARTVAFVAETLARIAPDSRRRENAEALLYAIAWSASMPYISTHFRFTQEINNG